MVYNKGTDIPLDEEADRPKSERVWSIRASVFVKSECTTLSVHGCVDQSRSSLNPDVLGIFFLKEASSCHGQLLIQSPAPLPSEEDGAESSKLLIRA